VNEFPRGAGARPLPRSRRGRLAELARSDGPGLDSDAPRTASPLPFGPGREAYTKRTRGVLAIVLVALVGVTVTIGAVLATGRGRGPLRVVTIPLADRGAAPALLRAAEAVGFEPRAGAGAGQVESDPLVNAYASTGGSLLRVGAPAPSFSLRTPTGVRVGLRGLRGRAVLLEFFATWCPHCAAEAPHLQRLYASLPHSAVSFLGINADGETAPSVLAYHIYFGLGFPVLLDPGVRPGSFSSPGSPGAVSASYRVQAFPTFYVLDRAGRVSWAGQGEQSDLVLRRELQRALAAPRA
jgi:thiol-disulfide isomerase/thioredoxin